MRGTRKRKKHTRRQHVDYLLPSLTLRERRGKAEYAPPGTKEPDPANAEQIEEEEKEEEGKEEEKVSFEGNGSKIKAYILDD